MSKVPLKRPPTVGRLLDDEEIMALETLVAELLAAHPAEADPEFFVRLSCAARRFPDRLLTDLEAWRQQERTAALVLSGWQIDDAALGLTPRHWSSAAMPSTRREDLYLLLLGAALGDPFAWSTLQDGRLVHNVLPIPGEETKQSGHSSDVLVGWHTEDSFHPYRCDYLGLMSIRNVDGTATTVSSVDDLDLTALDLNVLSQPRFVIEPDIEHLKGADAQPQRPTLGPSIREQLASPQPNPVVFGDPARPYLCIDPAYMEALPDDAEAERALATLIDAIEARVVDVILKPGDVLFVDNFLAVHGRKPFRARYDGTDRWLKKVSVTKNLRKSRAMRASAESRVIG
ncbi:MAG: TauD/TfdA family dioxygenase [Propionibacteriales bacterium]|nr:TauD/TfdA family dioxygenase [Propionibacteriales bacterium]